MTAILFGSISTIADTSELQRDAFNRAFAAHGLDWTWSREDYLDMLQRSGGKQRIAAHAESVDLVVDVDAIHATKSDLFQEALASADVTPREGVAETIRQGKDAGFRIALVTTTSAANVAALVQALEPAVSRSDFDLVVDASDVDTPKPNEAAYLHAMVALRESSDACVAIEHTLGGSQAAHAAELRVVAFPNENTAGHDFGAADTRVERLSFPELRSLIPAA
jgi:HAD superfamily hydrolase (TIGR01509 family)